MTFEQVVQGETESSVSTLTSLPAGTGIGGTGVGGTGVCPGNVTGAGVGGSGVGGVGVDSDGDVLVQHKWTSGDPPQHTKP